MFFMEEIIESSLRFAKQIRLPCSNDKLAERPKKLKL